MNRAHLLILPAMLKSGHVCITVSRTMLFTHYWSGATHWDQFGQSVGGGPLPGNEPQVFFAPAQIQKRDGEWGRGAMLGNAHAASIELVTQLAPTLLMESHSGVEVCDAIWQALLRNEVSVQRGVMMSLQAEA